MKLFKQGLRGIVSSKVQLTILAMLIFLCTLLSTVMLTTSYNTNKADRWLNSSNFSYDYSFEYDPLAKEPDNGEIIAPTTLFDTEYVFDGTDKYFPTISIGTDNEVFKNLTVEDISYDFVSNNKPKVLDLNFHINKNSTYFKNSTIGRISENEQDIYLNNYLSYLKKTKIYSNLTDLISSFINYKFKEELNENNLDKYKDEIVNFINPRKIENSESLHWSSDNLPALEIELNKDKDTSKIIKNDLYDYGLRGNIGIIALTKMKITQNNKIKETTSNEYIATAVEKNFLNKYIYESSDYDNGNLLTYKTGINENKIVIANIYNPENIFTNIDFSTSDFEIFSDFIDLHFNIIAKSSGFELTNYLQFATWDNYNNNKYRIVSYRKLMEQNKLKFLEKSNYFNDETLYSDFVVVTPDFASKNNLKIDDSFDFMGNKLKVGGIAIDSLNTYPTIYDTDIIDNTNQEDMIYLSPVIISIILNKLGESDYKDSSRIYLKSTEDDKLISNLHNFKVSLIDNDKYLQKHLDELNGKSTVDSTYTNANLKSFKDLTIINLRFSLLKKAVKIFTIVSSIFLAILVIILVFMTYIIIKNLFEREAMKIGTLKTLGYTKLSISAPYWMSISLFSGLMISFAWLIGVLLEKVIISNFYEYFLIPHYNLFNPYVFLIILGSLFVFTLIVSFTISIIQLRKHPLELIYKKKDVRKISSWYKFINKIHAKTFTRQLSLNIISTSGITIFTFCLIFAISTTISTIIGLIPTYTVNLQNGYFKGINYNNEYLFNTEVANDPFTNNQGNLINTNDIENVNYSSPVPEYYYNVSDLNKNIIDITKLSKDEPNMTPIIVENAFINNFLTLFNQNISINVMDDIYQKTGKSSILANNFTTILTDILPSIMDKKPVTSSTNLTYKEKWEESLTYLTDGFLPAVLKEEWSKDKTKLDNFILSTNGVLFNEKDDELISYIDGKLDNNKAKIYGINNNSKMIDGNINQLKENEVIVNEAFKNKFNKNVGDNLALKYELKNHVIIKENDNTIFPPSSVIAEDSWSYNDSGNHLNLDEIDKSKFTYTNFSNDESKGNNYQYVFKDSNGEFKKYYSMDNIELKINKNNINTEYWNKFKIKVSSIKSDGTLEYRNTSLFDLNNPAISLVGDNYIIKPYSLNFDHQVNDIYDFVKSFPKTWLSQAFELGLIKTETNIYEKNILIKGINKSYDEPRVITNKTYINKMLGKTNDYYNGKWSKEKDILDKKEIFSLTLNNGNYSSENFKKLKSKYDSFNPVIYKREILHRLVMLTVNLSIIFIVIIIVASLLTIMIAVDYFVNKLLMLLSTLKVMGYSTFEVNRVAMLVFGPFSFFTWLFFYLITWGTVYGVLNKIQDINNISLPFGTGLITMLFSFILMFLIYLISYLISYKKIKNINVNEFVLMSE